METQPKIKRRRVGVILEEGGGFRHLATVGTNPDGGIIAVANSWNSTLPWEGRVRQSKSAFNVDTQVTSTESYPSDSAPKLHYHRSGFTSIQPDNHRRISVDLPQIEQHHARQIFSIIQRDPSCIPPKDVRSGDMYVVSHDGWPTSVVISGLLVHRDAIPELDSELTYNKGRGAARGTIVENIMTLEGHGLQMVLVLRFDLKYDDPGPIATTTIGGFSSYGAHPTKLVYANTVDGAPKIVTLAKDAYPTFPKSEVSRSNDRRMVERAADGAIVEYGEHI